MSKKKKRLNYTLLSIPLRIATIIAANAVFIGYVIKNYGKYPWHAFILPMLAIFGFAAVIFVAAPRFAALFTGGDDFIPAAPDKPKRVKRTFWAVCLTTLVLHALTYLVGVLIYTYVKNGSFLPVPAQYWQNAWMKSNTDAGHYINIAENWYQATGKDDVLLVFFPMLPVCIRLANFVFHNSFLSAQLINGAAVTLSSGIIYLTLLPVIGNRSSRRAAILSILLPGAIFLNSPMTEPLFILFTACGFYFLGKRKYLAAGIFTALAGFTRSLGVILAIPIALVGIGQFISFLKKKDKFPWLLIPGLIVSVLGTLGYLYINYKLHGDPLKFFEFQKSNWHQEACPFYDTVRYMFNYFSDSFHNNKSNFISLWLPAYIAIFGSLGLMVSKAKKLPASYTAYFLVYFAVAIGCTWLLSSVRYLTAAFPIIAALGLSCRTRLKTAIIFPVSIVLYILYTVMYMQRLAVY